MAVSEANTVEAGIQNWGLSWLLPVQPWGCGNIWRFPTEAASNGGETFSSFI
ncbi:MAG: hypothetical protein U5K69_20885 [Balneolaceae bacterium]|nr:hypothetical protein [Balneolaceae bacterium]